MSFINTTGHEINCKIVYYGPGLCGKTTNIQYIYNMTSKEEKGTLLNLVTETERTLFFDFLPLALGKVGGYTMKFNLYTVPGQVFYDASRKLILRGVDGVVFVADSQLQRVDANLESMDSLRQNLSEQGQSLGQIPYVLQYNKRDVADAIDVTEMRHMLNPQGAPDFEASATQGIGVFQTLKGIARLVLAELHRTNT